MFAWHIFFSFCYFTSVFFCLSQIAIFSLISHHIMIWIYNVISLSSRFTHLHETTKLYKLNAISKQNPKNFQVKSALKSSDKLIGTMWFQLDLVFWNVQNPIAKGVNLMCIRNDWQIGTFVHRFFIKLKLEWITFRIIFQLTFKSISNR